MPRPSVILTAVTVLPVLCSLVALSASNSLQGTCLPSWAGLLAFALLNITCLLSTLCFFFSLAQLIDYARFRRNHRLNREAGPAVINLINLPRAQP
ncbi:E3 CR1-gamma1 [Titi monkey adenovirus ECC-2011]|uniref:E3 CR1-gamma1 n=1 Tax=titi monkey adenovirus 1 TaxID=3123084 RepID=G0ZAJ5_9ADEN|nr:E3 CR1-gamma1 [Titi monkey adenovirus ECC-2011]AEK98466.1 E3 CR1-gamma1 [Titi monkey adenovirus ECC-2011]